MRSLWGWGDVEARADLRETQARIEPFFGESAVEEAAAPRVPKARVEVPRELAEFSSADDTTRASRAMGKSYVDRVRGFRGDFSSAPDFVTFPRSEAELVRSRENLKGRVVLGMESTGARMSRLGSSVLNELPILSVNEMIERIDAVEIGQLRELAGALFSPSALSAAGVGPDEGEFLAAIEPLAAAAGAPR